MGIRSAIIKYNLYNHLLICKRRRRLREEEVSLITSNCLGGILYHILGLRFVSPFVNTLIYSHEFVRIVIDFERYIHSDLQFVDFATFHPVAMLGDVKIQFPHLRSNDDAQNQWNRRRMRLNPERLFFMLNDNGMTEEDFFMLDNCKHQNIVVFTAKPYPNHRCCFFLPCFANCSEVGNTLQRSIISGKVLVEEYFDVVGWLNQEKGSVLENYRLH